VSDSDHLAITRLQSAYADIVTRRAWSELHDVFLPNCAVQVDRRTADPLVFAGPGEIGAFIGRQIAEFDFFEFVILNSVITLSAGGDPDLATARMYMNELRHHGPTGRFTLVYGLYQDRYRRRDGRWWFDRRWYSTLARSPEIAGGRDLEAFEFPALPPDLAG
jgi:SnoaL-like domain